MESAEVQRQITTHVDAIKASPTVKSRTDETRGVAKKSCTRDLAILVIDLIGHTGAAELSLASKANARGEVYLVLEDRRTEIGVIVERHPIEVRKSIYAATNE